MSIPTSESDIPGICLNFYDHIEGSPRAQHTLPSYDTLQAGTFKPSKADTECEQYVYTHYSNIDVQVNEN